MSDNLLNEYKAYYAVRAERYAGNPKYSNSFEAEKKLADTVQGFTSTDDFKTGIKELSEQCGKALIKDEYTQEKSHFVKHQEHVRKLASERILAQLDSCANITEIITMVGEISTKNGIEISMDESHRQFHYDWSFIDEYIVYKNAVVPDKYKNEMLESADDYKKILIKEVEHIEQNHQHWQNGWKLEPDKNIEFRHRRLFPYSDENFNEQLALYKSIINR